MKKEILRINNLNYNFTVRRKLENISLCILEGECIGFLGLTYSGKDILVQLLDGDIEDDVRDFSVYIEGKRLNDFETLEKKIYKIAASNYLIDDWTVAEYIGLVDSSGLFTQSGVVHLEDEARRYFQEMGKEFYVSRKMQDLSEREKRVVDLVKAYKMGAKIVVIEDEFEGMSQTEVYLFSIEMKQMIAGKMSVIVNSHSNEIMSFLSDKYVIFNKGRIVKKCARTYIKSEAHLEKFLLEKSTLPGKLTDHKTGTEEGGKRVVYQVRNLYFLDKRFRNLSFSKGEVVALLTLDRKKKEKLFGVLSGRRDEEQVSYILESKCYHNADLQVFTREKIVSVKDIGTDMEIFPYMSVSDNLLLPSLNKLSSTEYILSAQKIRRMLVDSLKMVKQNHDAVTKRLKINELIGITLERWYIYNPSVLVLFEPFALCDIKGVSIVKSYIKKFAQRGTAVIIVKTREEYVEDISDRILRIDE